MWEAVAVSGALSSSFLRAAGTGRIEGEQEGDAGEPKQQQDKQRVSCKTVL